MLNIILMSQCCNPKVNLTIRRNKMRPRYVIVDKTKRDLFESKWQLPFGYNGCRIFDNEDKAIEFFKDTVSKYGFGEHYIIEKYDNGTKEIVYKYEEV